MNTESASRTSNASFYKAPLRGALVIGASSEAALVERLRVVEKEAKAGQAPALTAPADSDLRAPERVAIDYTNAKELADKATNAVKALALNQPAMWKALRAQGIFRGRGPAPKVAFLYTGQGSQYVNMLQSLRATEPIVAETFAEADRVMTPLLGKPLSKYIFVDHADANAVAKAEDDLRQTEITQPAVLATDLALTRLLAAYGVEPDFTMGHSLGEYGALVAAGGLPFVDSLEAVSARGRGMTQVAMDDNGRMAAVFAPLEEIERILKTINGYVVIANVNSNRQAVVGGARRPSNRPWKPSPKLAMRSLRCRSATPSTLPLWLEPASRCGKSWSGCTFSRRACPLSPTPTVSSIPPDLTSCRRCWTFSRCRSLPQFNLLKACARCTMPALACL